MNVCLDHYSGKRGEENFIVFTETDNPDVRFVVEIGHPPHGNLGPRVIKINIEEKMENSLGEESFVRVNWDDKEAMCKIFIQALIEKILNN
jgi:hypothetical protein